MKKKFKCSKCSHEFDHYIEGCPACDIPALKKEARYKVKALVVFDIELKGEFTVDLSKYENAEISAENGLKRVAAGRYEWALEPNCMKRIQIRAWKGFEHWDDFQRMTDT